ncbi:retrovirus-related pol polyprotein from transposon TNT 1-94 [Tanacetum coccineum]
MLNQMLLVEIILFIIDSGCSNHMTGNLKLLSNFVEKFLVGQFCDADLEVAFWKSTCYIRDLKGNDLLTASSSQAWLWHHRLSHLNFDTINFLSKYDIVTSLPKLKFVKDHLCSSCELGKAKHHVSSNPVPQCPTMVLEHTSLSLGPQSQENVPHSVETVTTSNELDFLFSPMFDELLNGTTPVVSKSSAITTADAPNQRQHKNTTSSTSTTVATDIPPLNIQTTPETISQAPTQAPIVTANENIIQAETNKEYAQVDEDEFINIFSTPPDGFVDPHHPDKVYRLKKALYGLKQAPRAWYDELSNFLVSKGFSKGSINPTLFITKKGEDILLMQIYVDDIIFGSTDLKLSKKFEKLMHSKFEMSMMGELKFFLGIQIHQSPLGIFINQAKYAQEILKKHGMTSCDSVGTPVATKPLDVDLSGTPVDQTKYRSMVGALITSGSIQFLGGDKLVSWSSKKQDCTSMSLAEAEYVSLSACCAQVLWLRTQLTDYGFYFDKIPMYGDSKAAIAISCNPVQHSCTKHIDLADMFTKALSEDRFKYLVRRLGMRCLTPEELEVLANAYA